MLHPGLRLRGIDERVGYGVFATEWIPTGTLLWVLDGLDQVLPAPAVRRLGPKYAEVVERRALRRAEGAAVLCWDIAKHMNHSCDPNALGLPHGLLDIAVRSIGPDVEVTRDFRRPPPDRTALCPCRSPHCDGRVRPHEFERISAARNQKLGRAVREMSRVRQPLRRWVEPALFERTVSDPTWAPAD